MPASVQAVSSSLMSRRPGSADSVVLPVPERPNRIAASPRSPAFAEQCMERNPRSGRRKFITVKIVFFTSPQ